MANLTGSVRRGQYGGLAGAIAHTQMPSFSCQWVKFKAEATNAGRVAIGGDGVTLPAGATNTTAGWPLAAGEETDWLPCQNLNEFYRICDNAGDDLVYMTLV